MLNEKEPKIGEMIEQLGFLIDDALIEIDSKLQIQKANGAGVKILGDNLIGASLKERLNYKGLIKDVNSSLSSKAITEFSTTPLSNQYRYLRVRLMPIAENRLLVLLMDMTLQHNVEKMRRDFVANVSHELRSPLTSLLGFVETMKNDLKMEETIRANFLNIMDEEAHRMSRLIDDLLSLSRVEIEEHITPTGKISIEQAIKSALDSIANRTKVTGHKFNYQDTRADPSKPSMVQGALDEIIEVFHNLLDNAIKYSYPNTEIKICLSENKTQYLTIKITNLGEGIDEKHIPRLTERFYRVDKGRSRQMGGTGLGLAIVKHIINKHRGHLVISSKPKSETIFEVQLPYYPQS